MEQSKDWPMDSLAAYNAFGEAYEVVRTVILVGNDAETYRIEVLKDYLNSQVGYTTRTYQERTIKADPAYPKPEFDWAVGSQVAVWDHIAMPWTARNTADSALQQAISFLAERAGTAPEE